MLSNYPLVSVTVLTYNSEAFVLETLNSVRDQDYPNIELVISDDCSKDSTYSVCVEWLNKHQNRFKRSVIVKADKNEGIPANFNRAARECHGKWKKIIAGDDVLLSDCIRSFVEFCNENINAKIVFSNMSYYQRTGSNNNYTRYEKPYPFEKKAKFELPPEKQLEAMYNDAFCFAPTMFISTDLDKIFPYREEYRLMEDYPHWIDLLENNIRFYYLDKPTVLYRIHESTSQTTDCFVNANHIDMLCMYFYRHLYYKLQFDYPEIFKIKKRLFFKYQIEIFLLRNKQNYITRLINKILSYFY